MGKGFAVMGTTMALAASVGRSRVLCRAGPRRSESARRPESILASVSVSVEKNGLNTGGDSESLRYAAVTDGCWMATRRLRAGTRTAGPGRRYHRRPGAIRVTAPIL